ncbi:alpha/beta fold hydrolase [Bacillus sp. HMF5848]|uniref:alpha/beta hydrolase n=1 Tax=Bacillus sp. HMF5848 TaxID=2495421 RepID=UPI000F78D1B9|nr:alpha/beta fold hydrolase [Bacillus sp. HMF5848]RSK25654.1 alpha/beta fold hydrolase [Bacillus sp. HMF5848]
MIGCLCIHGFTGSPQELAPLVKYLKVNTNWKILTPTLPGHGNNLQLKGVTYNNWIECIEEAYQKLAKSCNTIYVVGFSMGGMLASYLAVNNKVDKLVLLSAAAYYVNPRQLVMDIKEMVTDSFRGQLRENDLFLRYTNKMKATPMQATLEFRKLVKYVKPMLKDIKVPTLIIQGVKDGIVPAKSAEFIYNTIPYSDKKLCWLPSSKHLVCHDVEKDILIKEISDFLKKEDNLVKN